MEALFNLLLSTGLRPGEALALRWEDLDLQRGRLVVQRALIERAKGSYVIGPPSRALVLPWEQLRQAWLDHNAEWFTKAESEEDGFRVVVAHNSGYSTESLAVPIQEVLRTVQGSRLLALTAD